VYIYICMYVFMYIYTANREPNNDQSTICETTTSGDCTCRTGGFDPTLKPRSTHRFDPRLRFLYRNGAFTFTFFLNNLFSFGRTKYEKKMTTFAVWELTSVNKFFRPSTTCLQRVWMSCPQISVHGRKLHWNVTTNQRDVHRFWNPWLVGLVTVQREIIF